MTEEDINTMHEYVDGHHETLDNELQELMKKMKTRMIKEHNQHYQPIIQKQERRVAEQRQKNAIEAKRGEQLKDDLGRVKLIISRFVNHIAELKAKDHTANVRSRVFKAWSDLASGRAILAESSLRLYLNEPMKRVLFKRWVRRMRKVRQQRLARELRHVCQHDIASKETAQTQQIASLKAENAALDQLHREHDKNHDEMVQKIKRAIMRGVVGFNLEAMDALGEAPSTVVQPPIKKSTGLAAATHNNNSDDDADEDNDRNDFYVEPAPKISVIRHR